MKKIDSYYNITLRRILEDITSGVMTYLLFCKEENAFDNLVESLKENIYKDAPVQSSNEVSKSKDSKKD